ncbi:hypothetical protein S7711_03065 [Stachybotrys chartarum IBT 7711]|uniref:ATP-dependent DNA helicase PIF1 n=1 Tax=Stachybotrys chartarum (strain CBS 109288 / IBT 7711) TaxID=1280523 RepID=A0A084APH7_STACB|nr:hypothetical protein S7711_03065 [Stachybotrys chartarum IBT 7711]KFA75157.1 hypothetical protein S40288_02846 [Stachybotrys chartarum IBT 40288]
MLSRANQKYEVNPPRRKPLEKQLFPSSSPSAPPADIRDQLKNSTPAGSAAASRHVSARTVEPFHKPLDARVANASSSAARMASLYDRVDSFKSDTPSVDLTGISSGNKAKQPTIDLIDDFSDDDFGDIDYDHLARITGSMPATSTTKENIPPPPSSNRPDNSIPWSSSPASHFAPPKPPRTLSGASSRTTATLKRESDNELQAEPAQNKAKKRRLPSQWSSTAFDTMQNRVTVTANEEKSSRYWGDTADALVDQKPRHKGRRHNARADLKEEAEAISEYAAATAPRSMAISLSSEQKHVLDLVVNKGRSVFFTGPAGTGKSVLMRAIIKDLKKKYSKDPERVAVTASTGLAACNIGGITLHSFSGIGLGKEDAPSLVKKIRRNPNARQRWLKTKCLIIDEISMVDGELWDKLDHIGRTIRNNGRPWGGIQIVVTGDFFQLPPVPDHGQNREAKFAFDAATWDTSLDHTIGLTQVFRQRDPQFAAMLNEMRLGKISPETEKAFKALARPLTFDDGVDLAELFPTRAQVDSSNEKRLRELKGKSYRYDAADVGPEGVKDRLLVNMMAPKALELKVNAQVMLIKNLDDTLVNGSLGKVIAFSDDKLFDLTNPDDFDDALNDRMARAKKKLKTFSRDPDEASDGVKYPVVQFSATDGTPRVVLCQPMEWKVELPNGDLQAKRTQVPLILAWALSIHKAQGQTLERVTVNLGRVFEKGQAYVALSRATSQHGLRVLGFDKNKVMAHPRVVAFYNKLYSAEEAAGRKPQTIADFAANHKATLPMTKVAQPNVINIDDNDDEAEALLASHGY